MPVPGFLASFADKAQSAINSSPLAAHLPTAHAHADQQSSNPDSSGYKSHTLESISNQLRVISQQYSSAPPVQKIVTAEKAVALDFDSVSRSSKYQSKELYSWGQAELEDIKDVTDRLAYLNFVQGSLASSLAQKLNLARAQLKVLRDAENALGPRRAARVNLSNLIAKLEHDQQRGAERRIAELKEQLRKAELEDQTHEKEIEILKRKAIRESEAAKWNAVREYGEKLVLMSQAATQVITALPAIPPTPANAYAGAQATAAARAALQRALDNYRTGYINLPTQSQVDLDRSDTRSFGESHATELTHIDTEHSSIPNTPPAIPLPLQQASQYSHPIPDKATPPPIDPSHLNQSPASIPTTSTLPAVPESAVPAITPTVAETGIPVSAGAEGPGPATGSLHDLKGSASNTLQNFAEPTSTNNSASKEHYETAEEEKKRLERQEREKLLAAGGSDSQPSAKDDDELPPYQEL